VRELPGSFQSATSSFPSGKALMYFGLFLATGIFFVFIAFALFLPVMVLMPQKFAICFTLGCALIIASLFALKGPANRPHDLQGGNAVSSALHCCYFYASCNLNIKLHFILWEGGMLLLL